MKAISKGYIPKKSEIITAAKVKTLLTKKLSNNIPEEIACKIYIALAYFGLLRNSKAFKIQDTDIFHNKRTMKLNMNFPYASKHHKKGFSFYIPKHVHKLFDKYKKQLTDHGRMIEKKLGLKEKSLTANFGRRSGAVALTDAGILMTNLKQAGRNQHQQRKQTVLREAVPQKGKQWTIILYTVTTAIADAAIMAMIA
eukprot:13650109-Ditylum_brightwellii.AAC.1